MRRLIPQYVQLADIARDTPSDSWISVNSLRIGTKEHVEDVRQKACMPAAGSGEKAAVTASTLVKYTSCTLRKKYHLDWLTWFEAAHPFFSARQRRRTQRQGLCDDGRDVADADRAAARAASGDAKSSSRPALVRARAATGLQPNHVCAFSRYTEGGWVVWRRKHETARRGT